MPSKRPLQIRGPPESPCGDVWGHIMNPVFYALMRRSVTMLASVPGRSLFHPSVIRHTACWRWSSPSSNTACSWRPPARPRRAAQVTGRSCRSASRPSRSPCTCQRTAAGRWRPAGQPAGCWRWALPAGSAETQTFIFLLVKGHQGTIWPCTDLDEHDVVVERPVAELVDVDLWDVENPLEALRDLQVVFAQHHLHQTAPEDQNQELRLRAAFLTHALATFLRFSVTCSDFLFSSFTGVAESGAVLTVSSSGQQKPPTEGALMSPHSSVLEKTEGTPDTWWRSEGPPGRRWSWRRNPLKTESSLCSHKVNFTFVIKKKPHFSRSALLLTTVFWAAYVLWWKILPVTKSARRTSTPHVCCRLMVLINCKRNNQ